MKTTMMFISSLYPAGRDSQLEMAISEVLSQLEGFENPVSKQAPPLPTELGK